MTFTGLAENRNNIISLISPPLEKACIQVKEIFTRREEKYCFTVHWNYDAAEVKPTPLPPEEVTACSVEQVQLLACRVIPVRRYFVSLEVRYRVRLQLTYRDRAGNCGVVNMEQDQTRRSPLLPGIANMTGEVDFDAQIAACMIERGKVSKQEPD